MEGTATHSRTTLLIPVMVVFLSGACSTSRPALARARARKKPSARKKTPTRRKTPTRKKAHHRKKKFVQYGIASWYGKRFHGGKTASGERYNMHTMTAAHRTLPFGTIVRVTRLKTGRVVTVRINNRGPYAKGRVIDLSRKAASKMDILRAGVTRVRVEVLKWGSGRRVRSKRRRVRAKSRRKSARRARPRRKPKKPAARKKGKRRSSKSSMWNMGPFGRRGPALPRG